MRNLLWSGLVMAVLLSGCGWSGSASRPNTITPLTSITITAAYSTIAKGTSVKLTATGDYSGLFTRDISNQVVWSSKMPAVANFATNVPNRVAGQTPGSAVLTATMGGVSANFDLKVSSATATTVTITPANPSIALGLNQQFTATGTFSDGTVQDITFDATWASGNTTVAKVSNAADDNTGGVATSPQESVTGTTTITATFGAVNGVGGINGSTVLTVTAPVLQSIAVATSNNISSVPSLSTVSFTATGTYSNNTTLDITSQVNWVSSNANVAPAPLFSGTLASTQTVTQGTTTITATLGTISGTTTLNVTGGNLASFPALTNMTVVNGTSVPISVTGNFSNASARDITGALKWSIANPTFANMTTVSPNRLLIRGLAPGTTTITAASPGSAGQISTAYLTVTNTRLNSFSVSPQAGLALMAGTSGRLTATANFSNGTSQDVTANVTWGSNSTAVATVGTVGPTGERITGRATGATTITASFGNLILTTPVPVSVSTRTLKSFTIIPSGTVSVVAGNQTSFTVTATYNDGTTVDITSDVNWTTGDGNVAILPDPQNQPGRVVGVGSGTSTSLTATFNGQTATVTLNVQ
ncbi:MAG: Ig-like domain-containing protein [Oryzomonas sp.]|uniref:beta strand repeat-containing protein n=1 Tax=Oryzomonas sp. TaxID=2855186 RepID=UPI0028426FE5|nr:Ig-like domain-containing protein [Oryzomonas sp.]MDR3581206.1 Ig-like domain-containing protein [Oryzomonas sp.]